jgi:hypothetical protein
LQIADSDLITGLTGSCWLYSMHQRSAGWSVQPGSARPTLHFGTEESPTEPSRCLAAAGQSTAASSFGCCLAFDSLGELQRITKFDRARSGPIIEHLAQPAACFGCFATGSQSPESFALTVGFQDASDRLPEPLALVFGCRGLEYWQ